MNVFIIHGAEGHPGENWFPWLKGESEKLGCEVFVPKFPTPEGQTLENWLKNFEEYKDKVDENTVVIGHSLGVLFLLTILEKMAVRSAYFVAGYDPGSLPESSEWYEGVKTFVDKPFDWARIKRNCKDFHIYHSDNDPWFPVYLAENLGKKVGVEPIIVEGAGHFNADAGYTEFGELLGKIKTEICRKNS